MSRMTMFSTLAVLMLVATSRVAAAGDASAMSPPATALGRVPETIIAEAPPAPPVGWLGLGVRVGINQLSLSAARAASTLGGRAEAVARANRNAVDTMNLDASIVQVVPTLHLGGSGQVAFLQAARQLVDLVHER